MQSLLFGIFNYTSGLYCQIFRFYTVLYIFFIEMRSHPRFTLNCWSDEFFGKIDIHKLKFEGVVLELNVENDGL